MKITDVLQETPKNKTAATLKNHYEWVLNIVAIIIVAIIIIVASSAIIIIATIIFPLLII